MSRTGQSTIFKNNDLTVALGDGIKGVYLHLDGQDNIILKNGATTHVSSGHTHKLTTEILADHPSTQSLDLKRVYDQVGPGEVITFDEGQGLVLSYEYITMGGEEPGRDFRGKIFITQGLPNEEKHKHVEYRAPDVQKQ